MDTSLYLLGKCRRTSASFRDWCSVNYVDWYEYPNRNVFALNIHERLPVTVGHFEILLRDYLSAIRVQSRSRFVFWGANLQKSFERFVAAIQLQKVCINVKFKELRFALIDNPMCFGTSNSAPYDTPRNWLTIIRTTRMGIVQVLCWSMWEWTSINGWNPIDLEAKCAGCGTSEFCFFQEYCERNGWLHSFVVQSPG